jgi:hypothetical protein
MVRDLLLFLWQLPQVLLGGVVMLWFYITGKIKNNLEVNDNSETRAVACLLKSSSKKAFTLGWYIFVYDGYTESEVSKRDKVIIHELGHVIQSEKLGWFYLLIIAIPSLLFTGISPRIASKMYFETWANKLTKGYVRIG